MNGPGDPPLLVKALSQLALWCWRKPWTVLSVVGAVTVVFGLVVTQLRIDASIMGALNDNDPEVIRLQKVTQEFQAASGLVLVIQGGSEDDRKEVARRSETLLRKVPHVLDARAQVDQAFIEEFGLLYLSPEVLKQRVRFLGTLAKAWPLVVHEGDLGLGRLNNALARGQTDLGKIPDALAGVNDYLEVLLGGTPRSWTIPEMGGLPLREGWFASEDGSLYAVDVRTSLDPISQEVGMKGFGAIGQALDPLRQEYPDLQIRFAGMVPAGYQDQQSIVRRLLPLSTISLILVLCLLTMLDRRFLSAVLVGSSLIISLVWTFGLVHLVLGYASVMAAGFAVLLFGLGVDHGAHLLVRYNHERTSGLSVEDALTETLTKTGRGVVVGSFTTAIAFALMSLIDFKAAVHLGITAAMGLTCALITMLTVLPAGLRLLDKEKVRPSNPSMSLKALNALVAFSLRKKKSVFVAACVVLGVLGFQFTKFELETDLEKVMTQDLPAIQAAKELKSSLGLTIESVLSVAPTIDESRTRAQQLESLPEVSRVEGIHQFLPTQIPEKIAVFKRVTTRIKGVDLSQPLPVLPRKVESELGRLTKRLQQIVAALVPTGRTDLMQEVLRATQSIKILRQKVTDWAEEAKPGMTLTSLQPWVAQIRALSQRKSFGLEDLPENLKSRYVREGGFLSFVYPVDDRLESGALHQFEQAVHGVDPQATGSLFIVDYLLVGGVTKMHWSLLMIVLAIMGILFWDLRKFRDVFICLVPLLFGSVVSLGLVLAWGRPITLIMLSAFPLIFGIGIDDGLHILHRWREGQRDVAASIASIGKAILFTSVSTACSFSILLFLNHNGFGGLAIMVILGVITCFLTSVTLLPILASWLSPAPRP